MFMVNWEVVEFRWWFSVKVYVPYCSLDNRKSRKGVEVVR